MRINVNISDDVIKRVDEYAAKNGVTRSTAITVLLLEKLLEDSKKSEDSKKDEK